MRNVLAILPLLTLSLNANHFAEGNRQYNQGNLPAAIDAYQRQIDSGRVSPALHYNLGNAYFQQGNLGQSIYHFNRAHQLDPRDADIRANHKFARDTVHGQRPRTNAGRALIASLTLDEWTLLAAAGLTLWFLLAAVSQWRPPWGKTVRPYTMLVGGAAVLLTTLTILAWRSQTTDRTAVIVTGEAVIRHTPWVEAEPKFTLSDGEEIRIVRRHQGWTMVEDQATRWGWLPSDQILSFRHN